MSQLTYPPKIELEESFLSPKENANYYLLLGQTEAVKKNIDKALDLFKKSSLLTPEDPFLHFEQGLSLFDLSLDAGFEKNLLIANKKFKIATTLQPSYFEAWQLWGTSLSFLGKTYEEAHYFLEAEKKLDKAIELSVGQDKESLYDLFFEYGLVKAALATRSKEAYDWQLSLQAFERASKQLNSTDPEFWNSFGLSCRALAELVGDIKLCVKAIHCFKQALVQEETHYEGWKNLSQTLLYLYHSSHDEDHFFQTNECFSARAKHYPMDASLWLEWAIFLQESGRATQDVRRLRSSLEKSTKACSLEENFQEALACLGESMSLIGELSENIELIHEGQNKIQEALDLNGEDPLIWKSLGESYICLGQYFEDPDYLYLAIEKFQQGLSLNRTRHELWFAIGRTYSLIGDFLNDVEILDQALYFLTKAIDLLPRQNHYRFEQALCLSKIGEFRQEEQTLESSIAEFEKILHLQKNAIYLHPEWLFHYARTLDLYAEFFEEESYYHRAIEIYSHVLMIDPDYPDIHYQLALVYSHLGELADDIERFYKALHFFKLALKHDEENDQILVDLGVTLINVAEYTNDPSEKHTCYTEAETKLSQAAKAGNLSAYYQLACLFSLIEDVERSLSFLAKAESFHFIPSLEELLEDEWLENTRSTGSFQDFFHYLEKKASLQEEI